MGATGRRDQWLSHTIDQLTAQVCLLDFVKNSPVKGGSQEQRQGGDAANLTAGEAAAHEEEVDATAAASVRVAGVSLGERLAGDGSAYTRAQFGLHCAADAEWWWDQAERVTGGVAPSSAKGEQDVIATARKNERDAVAAARANVEAEAAAIVKRRAQEQAAAAIKDEEQTAAKAEEQATTVAIKAEEQAAAAAKTKEQTAAANTEEQAAAATVKAEEQAGVAAAATTAAKAQKQAAAAKAAEHAIAATKKVVTPPLNAGALVRDLRHCSAATLETGHAVEDARSEVTNLWGADQLAHKEKVKEPEDRFDYQSKQAKGLKVQMY